MKLSVMFAAVTALALTTGASVSAPCNTGSGKDRSASADPGSRNLAGGGQPASPGTVGAMNNVGSNQGLGDKQAANTATEKGKDDPGSKNLAGGQQPASPGTVGAMNKSGVNQGLGEKDDGC